MLVAPILLPGISPYHMEFPGTIALSADTVQRVYFEAAQSLMHHGFRRFLILTSHTGNQHVSRYIVDRINQETAGIAVELGDAAAPFLPKPQGGKPEQFDRHAGIRETSGALYLFPNLVDMTKAGKNELTLPDHLRKMLPQVVADDEVASKVFLAEALKPAATGKRTSTREMTKTGVWSEGDTREASAARGRQESEAFVRASVLFIDQWKALTPLKPLAERRSY